jgi:hypothetical protein
MNIIYQHYTYGPYTHEALRSLYRIFDKTLMPKLALFYHPLRVSRAHVYESVSRADGALLEGSGAVVISTPKLEYMGINAIIPLIPLATTPDFLLEIFKLISA